jgi:hypothetical protein
VSVDRTIVREKTYGDFLIRFAYVNTTPHEIGSTHDACIMLCRPERFGVRNAAIILDNAIHKYVKDSAGGGPSQYCCDQAALFAEMLGLTPDRRTIFRICEAIIDSVEGLYAMPPYNEPNKVIGEVEANFGGQRIISELYQ